MARFTPITAQEALPTPGIGIERPVMDLKVDDNATMFERAKDVAAFANHLGGCLIIGAAEQDGKLGVYKGLRKEKSADVRDAFSKAVQQRCQPLPRFECEDLPCPTTASKRVVVVNTWPSVLLVGVKVRGDVNDGYGDACYVYPVRTGTDAKYLEPSQLAMYMMPSVRRVAVLLSAIPTNTVIEVFDIPKNDRVPSSPWKGKIQEVRELENVVLMNDLHGAPWRRLPLDCINTAFEDVDASTKQSCWRIWMQFYR